MKTMLAVVVALCLATEAAVPQGAWERIASPIAGQLRSVSFAGSDTGYAVAWEGQILRTKDGGLTWDVPGIAFGLAEEIVALSGGQVAIAVGPVGIKRTLDAGDSWQPITQFPFAPYLAADFYGSTGWIVGSGGVIAISKDTGSTWQVQTSGVTVSLRGVCAIDETTAVAVGDESTVIKTTDGGASWDKQDLGGNIMFLKVSFWHKDVGYIVGGYSVIFRTTDGGASWSPKLSGTADRLNDVACLGQNDAVAVGAGGDITVTSDQGNTWQKQASGVSAYLISVSFLSPAIGIAVGDSGVILRTTTSGKNDVRELPGLPTEYRLDQNYPNPFNPATVIRYEIARSADVRLSVYDLLGQEMAVLVKERQTPGIYEADFTAASLPSGAYIYRLTADGLVLSKKMLLLK